MELFLVCFGVFIILMVIWVLSDIGKEVKNRIGKK